MAFLHSARGNSNQFKRESKIRMDWIEGLRWNSAWSFELELPEMVLIIAYFLFVFQFDC